MTKRFLTVREFARETGLSYAVASTISKRPDVPGMKYGNRFYFLRDDVDEIVSALASGRIDLGRAR